MKFPSDGAQWQRAAEIEASELLGHWSDCEGCSFQATALGPCDGFEFVPCEWHDSDT